MAVVWGLRFLFLTTAVTCSLSFVLRRRNWDDDADAGLAEALPVLRKERRRLEEQPLDGRSYWGTPEVDTDLDDVENEEEVREEALQLQPRFGLEDKDFLDSLLAQDDGELYEQMLGADLEGNLPEGTDDEDEITESPADLKELENILKPSEDEKEEEDERERGEKKKKNIPAALGGPVADRPKRDDSRLAVSDNELNSLLEETADDLERESLMQPDKRGKQPVSKAELMEVLDENVGEDREEQDPDAGTSWEPSQEEVLPPLNSYAPIVPLKIKRSNRNQQVSSLDRDEGDDIDEDDDGRMAREYIRRFLELEDDENTNLANALNLATVAQVRRTDRLVGPEATYIRRAIADEQAIQALRAAIGADLDNGDEADGSWAEAEEQTPSTAAAAAAAAAVELAKREVEVEQDDEEEEEEEQFQQEGFGQGEYPTMENDEFDDEDDHENMIQNLGYFDDNDRADMRDYSQNDEDLADKLREYLEHANAIEQENEVEDNSMPFQKGEWLDRPIEMAQEGLTEEDWELNPLLRELYERYRTGQVAKRGAANLGGIVDEDMNQYEPEDDEENEVEVQDEPTEGEIREIEDEVENALEDYIRSSELEKELSQEDQGLCPAIELVDGCHYAVSDLGLKLDAEAMDLCNRHQLCYTCGAAHGFSSSDCDNGYLGEANRLCEAQGDEEECSTGAAGLFVLMLQSHRYLPEARTPAVCSDRCSIDFIIGVDSK